MARPRSAHGQRILDLVDIAPRTLDELVGLAGPLVHPAKAWRAAEHDRARNAAAPELRHRGNATHAIEVGRRLMIRNLVYRMTQRGDLSLGDDHRYRRPAP